MEWGARPLSSAPDSPGPRAPVAHGACPETDLSTYPWIKSTPRGKQDFGHLLSIGQLTTDLVFIVLQAVE
jgi:hypothetical protein